MPKPMLKQPHVDVKTNTILSATQKQQKQHQTKQMDKLKLERLLRKNRSKEYMKALHKLDSGGHVHNQNEINDIIDIIRNEFPEVEISSIMLGIVSTCYLGEPYEVHIVDMNGQIIDHYERGRTLPGEFEKARSIAMRGGYDFIEVYVDCCRAVGVDGAVSIITG